MNHFDLKSKIDTNIKQLEFYYEMYDKLQNKFSFFIVIYSFIFIYVIELFKYLFVAELNIFDIAFVILFLAFLGFFIQSIVFSYKFIKPVNRFYRHEPKYFYNDVVNQYKNVLNTEDEEILNEYVNTTYLQELEVALSKNFEAYMKKSDLFFFNFVSILYTLLIYIIISSFVIFEKRNQKNSLEIENYKEIINYIKK